MKEGFEKDSRKDAKARRRWVSGRPCALIGLIDVVAPALTGLSCTSVAPAPEPGPSYPWAGVISWTPDQLRGDEEGSDSSHLGVFA